MNISTGMIYSDLNTGIGNIRIENNQNSVLLLKSTDRKDVLRFESNGDIFVKDKLIENDKEIVDAFRVFLKQQGLINK